MVGEEGNETLSDSARCAEHADIYFSEIVHGEGPEILAVLEEAWQVRQVADRFESTLISLVTGPISDVTKNVTHP